MPSALAEDQYELLAPTQDTGFVFGTESTGYQTATRPKIEQGEVRGNDIDLPYEDGRLFGRDYRGGKSLNFEINVLTDRVGYSPLRANLDYLDAFESIWTHEQWRDTPLAYAVLRACEGGRTVRMYGRPREYDDVHSGGLTRQGYSVVTATFDLFDGLVYSDEEFVAEAKVLPSSEGGLIAPLVAPLTTTMTSGGEALVSIGGTRATWPIIEFHGPIANPRVMIGDKFVVGLNTSIGYGDYVRFDPRPWERAVWRASNGESVSGDLSGDSIAMRRARLYPGLYEVNVSGQDPTGTSFARIRYRTARSRP